MKIKWKEVFKFLSGAAFAGFIASVYLYINDVSVPFLGYAISSNLLGISAVARFILFLVFFYLGFLKK